MCDPLSIAAGVIGVTTAAANISSLLIKFIKQSHDAPRQAHRVLTEVSDMGIILSSLQSFLLGKETIDKSRTSLIRVNQAVVIVTGCVSTVSELQKLISSLKSDPTGILDRVKWARNESAISALIQRIQTHKASLSLILAILKGHTIQEAKLSTDRLTETVNNFYQEVMNKLQAIELRQLEQSLRTPSILQPNEADTLVPDQLDPPSAQLSDADRLSKSQFNYTFDAELRASPAYRRLSRGPSVFSLSTRHAHTTGWSILSDLSMANVSNISVISLAITAGEVYDVAQYKDPDAQHTLSSNDRKLRINEFGSQIRARLIGGINSRRTKTRQKSKDVISIGLPLISESLGDGMPLYGKEMTRLDSLSQEELKNVAMIALVIDITPTSNLPHDKASKVSVGMLMDLSAIFYLSTKANSAVGDAFIENIHRIRSTIRYQDDGNSIISIVGHLTSVGEEEHRYFTQRSWQTAERIEDKRSFSHWTEAWGPVKVRISVFCSLVVQGDFSSSSRRVFAGIYDQDEYIDFDGSITNGGSFLYSQSQSISSQDLAMYLLRRKLDEDESWTKSDALSTKEPSATSKDTRRCEKEDGIEDNNDFQPKERSQDGIGAQELFQDTANDSVDKRQMESPKFTIEEFIRRNKLVIQDDVEYVIEEKEDIKPGDTVEA